MSKLTLTKVKEAIDGWRSNKKTKCEPMPEKLWEQIRVVSKLYNKYELIKTLGISGQRYKAKIENKPIINSNSPPILVSVPSQNLSPKITSSIVIKRIDGLTVSIDNFTNDHLLSVIALFKTI